MQQEAENLDVNIVALANNTQKLAEDYQKGKNIAANLVLKNLRKPIEFFLRKWKRSAEEYKIAELESWPLAPKAELFNKLQGLHGTLEEQNNKKITENEDLKQASIFDAIEMATVNLLLY